ncbi:unnamed protein product [Lathyrus oleraceus]
MNLQRNFLDLTENYWRVCRMTWTVCSCLILSSGVSKLQCRCFFPRSGPLSPAKLRLFQPLLLFLFKPAAIQFLGINLSSSTTSLRNPVLSRVAGNAPAKLKQQESETEIDLWTLLEDGAGTCPSASNTASIGGGDHANLRAASWLKGVVRVRRTDLTYVGVVDDGS